MICPECYKENPGNSQFCKNCGCFLKISEKKDEKKVLKGRYKVLSLLGEGGMGSISLTYDLSLNKLCAVKGICKKGLSDLPEKERDAILKPFKKEAEMLASLRHPGLPCVTDYFTEKDVCYLVMDYIEGKDLETALQEYGEHGVPEELVVKWAKEILHALEYLHSQDPPVIYRDMKPENVMLRASDGRIMLIDFGLARTINPLSQDTMTSIGTPAYAPKELFQGQPQIRTDIYSLGATMHCLLTGIEPLPFKFEPVRHIVPSLPADLEKIIIKSLKDNPDERFSTAAEMLHAIEKISKKYEKNQKEDKEIPDIHKKGKIVKKSVKELIDKIFYEDEDVTLTGTQLIIQENEYNLSEIKSAKIKKELDRRYVITNGCIAFAMFISIVFFLRPIVATEAGIFILIFIGILYLIMLLTVRDYNYILILGMSSQEIKAFMSKDRTYMENLLDKINEVIK